MNRHKPHTYWLSRLVFLAVISVSLAAFAVPITFQYQGHIVVDGVAFEGTGLFKFALIDSDSATLWSHDGTSVDGGEPASAIQLEMARGVYQVELGDTEIENMTEIPASVFDGDSVLLRVWFDDGVNGVEQLAPDTSIGSVPFAIRAASAERADVAGTVESIPDGLIEDRHFSTTLQEKIATLSGLADKLVAISSDESDEALTSSGYTAFRTISEESWVSGSSDNRPVARYGHTGVWTGSDWIIWGGSVANSFYINTGGIYSAELDAWERVSPLDAPEARAGHSGVWTGDSMVVWGGLSGKGRLSNGGIYDLDTQTWAPTDEDSEVPEARNRHVSDWTGQRMVVWGGRSDTGLLTAGGLYDPELDAWTNFDLEDIPATDPVMTINNVYSFSASQAEAFDAGLESPVSVAIAGDFITIASDGSDNILRLNVSDLDNISVVAELVNTGTAFYGLRNPQKVIEVDDLVAFSVQQDNLVYVVQFTSSVDDEGNEQTDVSNLIRLKTSVSSRNAPRGLAIQGNYMYYTYGSQGIFVVRDITDPENSFEVTELVDGVEDVNGVAPELSFVENIVIQDEVAYVTARDGDALTLLDVSDPTVPTVLSVIRNGEGDFNRLDAPFDVAVSDGVAYVSAYNSDTVNVINIEDPANPFLISEIVHGSDEFPNLDNPRGLLVRNELLFIAASDSNVVVVADISDPASPKLLQELNGEDFGLETPYALAEEDSRLVVASPASNNIAIIDYSTNRPDPRMDATSVWTGGEFLVWGGQEVSQRTGSGFSVVFADEATPKTWNWMEATDSPGARTGHTAVWTGTEMIVWGGQADTGILGDGGRYDPETHLWTPIPADDNSPTARYGHTAVWTGSEMLILGGHDGSSELDDGHAYDPATEAWRALTSDGDPIERRGATGVWTGSEVMLFGGRASGKAVGSLQRLNPEPAIHLFKKQ